MLRVIAGEYGGRRLRAPTGMRTRPTADRVREALFNILPPPPPGSVVLDLYAGSGALGIEALSRGAATAVFVDEDKAACAVLRDNLRLLGLLGRATVLEQRVDRALLRLLDINRAPPGAAPPYHYIFVDPPYEDVPLAMPALLRFFGENAAAMFAPAGQLVIEHRRSDDILPPAPLGCHDTRRYGDTRLSFISALAEGALSPDPQPGELP